MAAKRATDRKRKSGGGRSGSRGAGAAKARPRKSATRKTAAAKNSAPQQMRAMSELTDAEKLKVFAAVQATLRASGIGNTLSEIHFASDELALVCPPGQVRRIVAFRCGPGVCTKQVCVPIVDAGGLP